VNIKSPHILIFFRGENTGEVNKALAGISGGLGFTYWYDASGI
jgi:hypothetical protein